MSAERLKTIGAGLRRRWWIFAILLFGFAAYTSAGFFLIPRIARSYVTDYVEKTLKRHVSIGDIAFNPFTFVTEIKNFALTEADNSPIASFDFLHVDFQLASFFNGAWTFKDIRIENPNLSVLVEPDGTLNLAKLAPPAQQPPQQPAKPATMPLLRIGAFTVIQGGVALEDRSRKRPFATKLTPIAFTLYDFRTAPDFQNQYTFEANTVAGERLVWSGQFSVQPLGSSGSFAVNALKAETIANYLQDALPFVLASGTVDLDGQYRVTLADAMGFQVQLPELKVHDVGIAPRGGDAKSPWIHIPETTLSNITFALPEQKLAVERIDVEKPAITLWRDTDGKPNLLKLLPVSAPAPKPAAKSGPSPDAPPAGAAASPIAISVGTIAVKDASIAAEDRMMRPAAKFMLSPLSLTITGYTSDPANPLKIGASVTVNGKGTMAAEGDVSMAPFKTTMALDVTNLDLTPLRPYIASMSGVQLVSGQLSAKTKIGMNPTPAKGQPHLRLTGEVTVSNFATRDAALRQDFIKWQRLQVMGIDYKQGPDSLSIDRIVARRPFGKVVISADRMLNVVAVLTPPGTKPPAPPPPAPASGPALVASAQASTVKPRAPAAQRPMPMRIRQIVVQDGSADFADFSIQPNFAAAISGIGGTIAGLSSDPNSRAEVKLAGNVDRYAPVDISGEVNLLSAAVFTDIAMDFRNMDLTTFNPYSGRYAGYNIAKGKLTTELHYKVENRKLDAQHHVVLDQLEFGQATDSKDAVPLPIRLAVALLKDKNGVIDLNLPVTGSLDDPQFRLGPIIWQVFVGLITKVVEAPFALIGSLFGGGEDLAYVDFMPGSAMLAPPEQEKLGKLAHALAERPGLKLDIPLKTLSPADDAALNTEAFDQALSSLLPMGAAVTPEQRMAALAQLYEQEFGMKPVYPMPEGAASTEGFDPVEKLQSLFGMDAPATPEALSADTAFLEKALKPKFMAAPAARETLARARADAVRDAILNQEGVMPERVFLTERESGKGEAADAVRMELSLQ